MLYGMSINKNNENMLFYFKMLSRAAAANLSLDTFVSGHI
jgi:hypothetical protein